MLLVAVCLGPLAQGVPSFAQSTPAEKELQSPLVLDDGKPTAQTPAEAGPSAWRALGSMTLVLGLAGGALWALRRYGIRRLPGSGGSALKVEETLALGDRRFVSILRAEDERFLIALAPSGITLLARLEGPEPAPGFADALSREQAAVAVAAPVPVREMEALLRGEQP